MISFTGTGPNKSYLSERVIDRGQDFNQFKKGNPPKAVNVQGYPTPELVLTELHLLYAGLLLFLGQQ